MSKMLLALVCLALIPGLTTAASPLAINVVDARTGEAIPDARIILNDGPAAEPENAEMIQKNRQFRPKTLLVAKGSTVDFPNRDATQHHVYSFSPAKVFNLELFADQPEAPILFDKTGIVEVGCNIHDQMQGFIVVTDSRVTATTDANGTASLQVPDAMADTDLSLSLWHPRLVDVTRTLDVNVSRPADDPVVLSLTLSPKPEETGRLDSLQKRYRDL